MVRKKDNVRAEFDSSAKHEGFSPNSMLLSGPMLMNSRVGVMFHYRNEPITVMPLQQNLSIVWDLNSDSVTFVITRSPSLKEAYCPPLTACLAP